jgi:hypothetical protein
MRAFEYEIELSILKAKKLKWFIQEKEEKKRKDRLLEQVEVDTNYTD